MVNDSSSFQQVSSEDLEEVNAPPQKGLNLRPILRTIQRNIFLIMGIAGVAIVPAVLSSSKEPSTYEGSFRLLVEPVTSEAKLAEPTALTRSGGGIPDDRVFNLDYPTQLEILQSPGMLSAIVEQIKTQKPKFTLKELQQGLIVKRLGDDSSTRTKIIEVRYQASNPDEVQLVLKKTADKYLKYSLDERKTRISEGIKFIEDQLPELQQRVGLLQTQLQGLQQRYSLIDPKAQGEDLFKQVRDLVNQQIESQKQLQEQKILYVNLQQQLELTPDQALAASALSQDPNRAALLAKLKEVESQIAIESVRFTPNSPNLLALQEKRQNLLTLLNQETQRILGRNSLKKASNPEVQTFQDSVRIELIQQLVNTTNQIQVLEARSEALAKTKNAFEKQAQQFPSIARQYNDIERKLEITNQTLNQLLTQRETLRIEAAQKNVPWEVISAPQLSLDAAGKPLGTRQSSSKKLMTGAFGGLLVGIVLAILLEKFRDIFYTMEDIQDGIELPLLGTIPLDKKIDKLGNSRSFLSSLLKTQNSIQNPSAFSEAFDLLYASVRFLYSGSPVRSLVVCSAASGDGKSTIALYLAQTAAEAGQRVLLVDANLRHPHLHNRLNLPNHKGLSDLLHKKLTTSIAIERSPRTDNLFVLTAGKPLPETPKHLASNQMQHLIREFEAAFDLVIYDTPDLLSAMDASFLSTHTDGLLMVVGVGTTKRSLVMQAINQINSFHLRSIGVVANYVQQKPLAASPDEKHLTSELIDTVELDFHEPSHPEMNSKSI